MEWVQLVLFFIGVFGLFIWNRAEARQDARHMDTQLRAQREMMAEARRDSMEMTRQIQEEIKDFHGRLCAIEERNRRQSL